MIRGFWTHDGHSEGESITSKSRWNCNTRKIQQVHEIGVVAKGGIESNGCLIDTRPLVYGAGRRRQYYVHQIPLYRALDHLCRREPMSAITLQKVGYEINAERVH